MSPTKFPADHIGSLLRPQHLLDAQNAAFQFGSLHNTPQPGADSTLIAAAYSAEQSAIDRIIAAQKSKGILPVTSGEFARSSFVSGFFEKLVGMAIRFVKWEDFREGFPIVRPYLRKGIEGREVPVAVGKVRWRESAYMDEWIRVREGLGEGRWGEGKITVPSPAWSVLQLKRGKAWAPGVYDNEDEYLQDCGEAVRQEILALYEAGCRYVQIDDPMLAMLCDTPYLNDQANSSNETLTSLVRPALIAHNAALRALPADLLVSIHLCRGNMPKGNTAAIGAFDELLPALFQSLNYKRFALEFDDPEITGGFEGLRHLPVGKVVVLGLVTTKSAEMEDLGALKGRVMEAADIVARGQGRAREEVLRDSLAVSPSCGFASFNFVHGIDAEETQWEKLELVKKLAEEAFPGL